MMSFRSGSTAISDSNPRRLKSEEISVWLPPDEAPGSALTEFSPRAGEGGSVSVWRVGEEKQNLDDVLIAIASCGV